ncbi:MAG: MYG1 family protein [Chlamydiia bacterium]|nr:MYG1 family protein [Chlamydiia bacterium]
MKKEPKSFGTHDGSFHADEVTATALLLLTGQIDRDKIFRTRDPKKLDICEFVADVGGIYDPKQKRFDHHQSDYTGTMSSAGMVLKYLKEQKILTTVEAKMFQDTLVSGVDAHDNGIETAQPGTQTYSSVISNFMPINHSATKAELDEAFNKALDLSLGHLSRMKERLAYILSTKEAVKKAMRKGKDVLLFDKPMPWMDAFFELDGEDHPAQFVIMPSGEHWKLRGIPPNMSNKMRVRKPLPKAWAGLLGEDLKKASGIEGAIFCHKGQFISVWETKEDAQKALELILKRRKK